MGGVLHGWWGIVSGWGIAWLVGYCKVGGVLHGLWGIVRWVGYGKVGGVL